MSKEWIIGKIEPTVFDNASQLWLNIRSAVRWTLEEYRERLFECEREKEPFRLIIRDKAYILPVGSISVFLDKYGRPKARLSVQDQLKAVTEELAKTQEALKKAMAGKLTEAIKTDAPIPDFTGPTLEDLGEIGNIESPLDAPQTDDELDRELAEMDKAVATETVKASPLNINVDLKSQSFREIQAELARELKGQTPKPINPRREESATL